MDTAGLIWEGFNTATGSEHIMIPKGSQCKTSVRETAASRTLHPGTSTQKLQAAFPNVPTSSGSSFYISQHGSHTQLSSHPSYCPLVPQCSRTPEISRKESGTLNCPYHHLPSLPHCSAFKGFSCQAKPWTEIASSIVRVQPAFPKGVPQDIHGWVSKAGESEHIPAPFLSSPSAPFTPQGAGPVRYT